MKIRIPARPSLRRALATTCVAAVMATVITACGDGSEPSTGSSPPTSAEEEESADRGAVVSVKQVSDLTAREVSDRLGKAGIDSGQVRYGVRAYRVVYRTVDVRGEPTTASQLVTMPRTDAKKLSVVSWLHGTTVYRGAVASVNEKSPSRAAALLFASTGHAVSAPDYLGLGKGPGRHPYGDPRATVIASMDALRAARGFADRTGRTLRRRVLVSGFSQGGPATMLVGGALQQRTDSYFRLGGLAPIAGPFNLSRFEAAAANDKVARAPLYLAYFTTAWDWMYDLYEKPAAAFRHPYDEKVGSLFDGDHEPSQIAAALPDTSKELFTEEFLDRIRDPEGELGRRLREMDTTCDWRPNVPVRLYHAKGDRDVWFSHSRHCTRQLATNGAEYELINMGEVGHTETLLKALPMVAKQFDEVS